VLSLYEATARAPHPFFERDAPETMLIDEVEAIWAAIAERDDWSAFDAKITAVRAMGAALAATTRRDRR
jgi:hypothetical protein